MPADYTARNLAIAHFRREVLARYSITLLQHQAEWQLASEGWTVLAKEPSPGDYYTTVLLSDPDYPDDPDKATRVRRTIIPRPHGAAHVLADLAAFKVGKSFGAAGWLAGFGVVPKSLIQLVGLEYATCEPEFNYLADFLLSERGMNMKPEVFHNDKRAGRMRIKLRNGTTFEVKSWERKEGLKGKKVLAYCFCEAYQLPDLDCYNSVRQNLRELKGWACFPTTPDRPWVGIFHERGHGESPDWHCTCGIEDISNPFTFDRKARDEADPEKGGIMTRERFAIAHRGLLGSFVGRVYDYVRGQQQFNPIDHPQLWDEKTLMLASLNTDVAAVAERLIDAR